MSEEQHKTQGSGHSSQTSVDVRTRPRLVVGSVKNGALSLKGRGWLEVKSIKALAKWPEVQTEETP